MKRAMKISQKRVHSRGSCLCGRPAVTGCGKTRRCKVCARGSGVSPRSSRLLKPKLVNSRTLCACSRPATITINGKKVCTFCARDFSNMKKYHGSTDQTRHRPIGGSLEPYSITLSTESRRLLPFDLEVARDPLFDYRSTERIAALRYALPWRPVQPRSSFTTPVSAKICST
jgi:hypothetical protein